MLEWSIGIRSAEVTRKTWNEVIGLNLDSAFFIAQAVGRKMIEARRGKIINVGSLKSLLGDRNIVSYAASKGGLLQMTKSLAVEWAIYNLQVNCIMPGYYITDLTKDLQADEERFQSILKRIPLGRWGNPEVSNGSHFIPSFVGFRLCNRDNATSRRWLSGRVAG